MRTIIPAIAALIISAHGANAQQTYRSATGSEFLAACKQGEKACPWLVLGIAESLNALKFASGATKLPAPFEVCIFDGTKADQIVDNVTNLMSQASVAVPQLYEGPASPLIASTLATAYPCNR